MRRLVVAALGLLAASASAAGPIRVKIDTAVAPRDPFLVRVQGHYADFHNGYSRHWRDALVRAGRRRTIDLGPVNPLVNMGVSVSIYHPEYVSARARSKKTPLLVRPVGFETFRPQSWRRVIETAAAFENGGPHQPLGQVLGHLQLFLSAYLPAVDEASGAMAVSDDSLRAHLPLLEELVRFGDSDAAAARPQRWVVEKLATDPAFARSMAQTDLETRAELRDLLHRAREWLSLPRERRIAVRRLMEDMRYPRGVGEALMTSEDLAELGAFLDRYAKDRAARRAPETAASWTNRENRVGYRVHVLDPPRQCAYLSISVDLTGVVPADLGDMTNRVKANFCRRASGEWRYGRS